MSSITIRKSLCTPKKTILHIIFILLLQQFTFGQLTKFQSFSAEQGLCSNAIYDIEQDSNGFLWLGTGEGLCRFDGFKFTPLGTDTLSQSSVNTLYKDSKGVLWAGFQTGAIVKIDGYNIRKVSSGKAYNNNSVIAFLEINGVVCAITQNAGLITNLESDLTIFTQPLDQYYITAIEKVNEETLLIGTFEGLIVVKIDNGFSDIETVKTIPDLEYIKVQNITPTKENDYLIGTEDAGLYKLDPTGYTVEKWGAEFGLEYENVQDSYYDPLGDLWLSTFGNGIIRLKWDKQEQNYIGAIRYNESNGLVSNDIKKVFLDFEGNYWVGTYLKGLACLKNEAFSFNEFTNQNIDPNITAIENNGDITWYASTTGILKYEQGENPKYTLISKGLPNDKITSLYYGQDALWIGTATKGAYKMLKNGTIVPFMFENNTLAKSINHINGKSDTLFVSTQNGLYVFYNNGQNRTLFNTRNGLGHNNIHQTYTDHKNNVWISSKSSGIKFLDSNLKLHSIFEGTIEETDYIGMVEDYEGHIWAATSMFGVMRFSLDTIININTQDGLKSPYCYSISKDINGNIWIGHRTGISKINPEYQTAKTYSSETGIYGDCNYNAMSTNQNQQLLIGTTEGLIIYDPLKDQGKMQKPKLNFTSIRVSYGETDMEFPIGEDIVLPYNQYSIRIYFIGLSYKSPETIKYQYKLEGYANYWSDLSSQRYAPYDKVTDGEYTFMVKACNAESMCNETPLTINIMVKKPFWKMWWFFILVAVILISTVIIIIKVRERNQKALQEYLQRKLDERTKEVVQQKEEIEVKNRDITDSINYAQRIQAGILPSIKTLQTYFSGSFVFYQPRDIVSGDFYWFGVTKNNKFIIVCADSTGHGVPGAFMSMIGTILIKDICSREEITKPSEILLALDSELSNTLNQNIDAERSNDGMDIIVCEIDIKTHYTRIASAMRPVIVYQNGQQLYVKGSRNSVGGHVQKEQKVFENEGFQLSKGDIVYMFSDGYPDQFGGPMEKKFKMVRLKNMLKDINQKPMDDQFNSVKNTFNVWKEGIEQIDDVLFMGIKI